MSPHKECHHIKNATVLRMSRIKKDCVKNVMVPAHPQTILVVSHPVHHPWQVWGPHPDERWTRTPWCKWSDPRWRPGFRGWAQRGGRSATPSPPRLCSCDRGTGLCTSHQLMLVYEHTVLKGGVNIFFINSQNGAFSQHRNRRRFIGDWKIQRVNTVV